MRALASRGAVFLRGGAGFNLADYALFGPAVLVVLVVATVSSARLARAMDRPWALAFALILSVGIIAAATLTPGRDALLFGIPGSGSCDLSNVALPTIRDLRSFNDVSLNVLLFLPLGLTAPFAGPTRPTVALLAASVAFPFVIEAIQLIVTPLGRSCQSVDVIDNLTGLVLGLGCAGLLGVAARLRGEDAVSRGG